MNEAYTTLVTKLYAAINEARQDGLHWSVICGAVAESKLQLEWIMVQDIRRMHEVKTKP